MLWVIAASYIISGVLAYGLMKGKLLKSHGDVLKSFIECLKDPGGSSEKYRESNALLEKATKARYTKEDESSCFTFGVFGWVGLVLAIWISFAYAPKGWHFRLKKKGTCNYFTHGFGFRHRNKS